MHLYKDDKKHNIKIHLIISLILFVVIGIIVLAVFIAIEKRTLTVESSQESEQSPQTTSVTISEVISSSQISAISSSEVSEIPSYVPASSEKSSQQSSSSSQASVASLTPSAESVSDITSESPISSEDSISSEETSSEEPQLFDSELPQGSLTDWNLILLNHGENNKIDKELEITKVKFDSQYVDERASEAYKNMYAAAQEANITLFLRSGYRSMKTQQVNYNANVQRLLKQGLTNDEAIRQTSLYYTISGHSEHHTGLAFDLLTPEYQRDIYTLDERFAKTEAYTWLTANCADYGFILRYPKDKTDITGINFEPWHYRYVGIEHAKYITENNLCLEEYITLLAEREE